MTFLLPEENGARGGKFGIFCGYELNLEREKFRSRVSCISTNA